MATIKSEYYRFNGSGWDLHYFKTSADLIVETTSYKVMTADERTAISTYLSTFNAANKLAQVGSNGKLPAGIIPALNYLPITGGTLTGGINVNNTNAYNDIMGTTVVDRLYVNGEIASDSGELSISVDSVNFNGASLKDISTPLIGTDAANKEYVDNLVSAGFKVKDPVKAASTADVN